MRKTFPAARRGVDGDAVRQYLETVAGEVRALVDREATLRRKLAEAERRAAEPELDEATLTRAVGAETARILETAHAAARDVLDKAEARARELTAEAEGLLSARAAEAEGAAEAILVAAEEEATAMRQTALEEAGTLRAEAREEAESLTEASRHEAEDLEARTRAKCREMVQEARQLRTSVLRDLADRRKALHVQLEQLRTGRDTIVEVVDAVGDAVDDLRQRLASAEHDARVAAAEAGERAGVEGDELDEELASELSGMLSDEELALELAVDEGLATELAQSVEQGGGREGDGEAVAPSTTAPRVPARNGGPVPAGDLGDVAEPSQWEASSPVAQATVEPGADAEENEGTSAATRRSVDELFAKIRSSREQSAVPEAELGVLGEASAHEAAVNETEEIGAGEGFDEDGGDAPAGGDAVFLARRTKLRRVVKRALQDDQNQLLDSMRSASGKPDLEQLLAEKEQLERFAGAVSEPLAEAFAAGSGFLGGARAADPPDQETAGRTLGAELAAELAGQLRRRLADALASSNEVGDASLSDAAGAAYREWRGTRIDDLAGDFTTQAFNGAAITTSTGVAVRWVVDDDGRPCPDCEDNTLAGPQAVGEPFPTGQTHPPVHPGCRCLLVPAD